MISENRPDRPDILRLRHHSNDLFALVGATAEHLGLDPAFVEKDFWVTELLRSLSRPLPDNSGGQDVAVVFKGGTSLSKVYRLVDRFSEDVDILLVCESVGMGQRDRVLKYLCARVEADLDRVERRTRLRSEWTVNGVTDRFFDYVPKGTRPASPDQSGR
jgi:predicted nucleotidyltransferase component of viral defense system